jgi:hypothetical protein
VKEAEFVKSSARTGLPPRTTGPSSPSLAGPTLVSPGSSTPLPQTSRAPSPRPRLASARPPPRTKQPHRASPPETPPTPHDVCPRRSPLYTSQRQRSIGHLVLPPAPNAHGGNDRTRGVACGARSRRPRGAPCSSYTASAPRRRGSGPRTSTASSWPASIPSSLPCPRSPTTLMPSKRGP